MSTADVTRMKRARMHSVVGQFSDPSTGMSRTLDYQAFEELSTVEVLELVRKIFESRQGTEGMLTEDDFVSELRENLRKVNFQIEENFLRRLFARVDVNADGSINWNEFSEFLLVENQAASEAKDISRVKYKEKKNLAKEITGNNIKVALRGDHLDMISRIIVMKGGNNYITCGRDGMIKTWSSKSNIHDEYSFDTIKHVCNIPTHSNSWITDAILLPQTRKILPLATTGVDRLINLYDMNQKYTLGSYDTPNVPHCIEAISQNTLCYGDNRGMVHLLNLEPYTSLGFQNRTTLHYRMFPKAKYSLHSDWVTKVRYLKDLNAFGSCSLDGMLRLIDFEKGEKNQTLSRTFNPGPKAKGLYTFDWIPSQKLLLTGGMGCNLVLWNLFTKKPIAELTGHKAAVTDILVHEKENQIISLSIDKTIAIWDLRTQRNIQVFKDLEQYRPEDMITGIAHDDWSHCIVTGAIRPKQWVLNEAGIMLMDDRRNADEDAPSKGSIFSPSFHHSSPVVSALHSPHINGIVSCDKYGTVCLWDTTTGLPQFHFSTMRTKKKFEEELKGDFENAILDTEDPTIVSICLDNPNCRKLITSSTDGKVRKGRGAPPPLPLLRNGYAFPFSLLTRAHSLSFSLSLFLSFSLSLFLSLSLSPSLPLPLPLPLSDPFTQGACVELQQRALPQDDEEPGEERDICRGALQPGHSHQGVRQGHGERRGGWGGSVADACRRQHLQVHRGRWYEAQHDGVGGPFHPSQHGPEECAGLRAAPSKPQGGRAVSQGLIQGECMAPLLPSLHKAFVLPFPFSY